MKTLASIALTAAVCLPVGAFAKDVILRGHPNLQKARTALNEADRFIARSQEANEAVWTDEGGHGRAAKEYITKAKQELDLAAEWVNSRK